jgi:hypothetical protein
MQAPPYFTDAEVDEMTAGLVQDHAKVRFLRRLGLKVDRKPNGRPLAWRPSEQPASTSAQNAPAEGLNIVGLQAWAVGRKGRNGAKAQGR